MLTYVPTGRGPFGTGSTAALIYRVVHGAPALDGISADLRALIERCLTKDPSMRPTASVLLAELGDVGVTTGWLHAPLTKKASADADGAPQLTATEAGMVHAITPSQELAFPPTLTRHP